MKIHEILLVIENMFTLQSMYNIKSSLPPISGDSAAAPSSSGHSLNS